MVSSKFEQILGKFKIKYSILHDRLLNDALLSFQKEDLTEELFWILDCLAIKGNVLRFDIRESIKHAITEE